MSWFVFILCALAVFRLALMLSSESGPAAIFAKLRRTAPAKTNVGQGLRCAFCWSVWLAAGLTLFLYYINEVPLVWTAPYAFALSGASVLLHVWQAE